MDRVEFETRSTSHATSRCSVARPRTRGRGDPSTRAPARVSELIGKKFEEHIVEALITAYEQGLVRPNMKVVSVIKTSPANIT